MRVLGDTAEAHFMNAPVGLGEDDCWPWPVLRAKTKVRRMYRAEYKAILAELLLAAGSPLVSSNAGMSIDRHATNAVARAHPDDLQRLVNAERATLGLPPRRAYQRRHSAPADVVG